MGVGTFRDTAMGALSDARGLAKGAGARLALEAVSDVGGADAPDAMGGGIGPDPRPEAVEMAAVRATSMGAVPAASGEGARWGRAGTPTASTRSVARIAPTPRAAIVRAIRARALRGPTITVVVGGALLSGRAEDSAHDGSLDAARGSGMGASAMGGTVGSGAITACCGAGVGWALGGARGGPTNAAAAWPSVSGVAPIVGGSRAGARFASRLAAAPSAIAVVKGMARRVSSLGASSRWPDTSGGPLGSVSCSGETPGAVPIVERS